MAPQARAVLPLLCDPRIRIDAAAAPAVLDHEARRRDRIERRHLVVGVPAERRADAVRIALRQVVCLADVIEVAKLDHQMMHAVGAGIDESQAVVAGIEMEEISFEWPQDVVAETKTEDVRIERHDQIEPRRGQDRMPHAERSGSETGDRPPRPKRFRRELSAKECLKPIANRIGEDDQIANAAFFRQRA